MSQGSGQDKGEAGPDLQKLAQDWITLWQSELAGLAVDREAQETWQAMLALWAGAATAMLRTMPRDTAGPAPGWYPPPYAAQPHPPGATPEAAASPSPEAPPPPHAAARERAGGDSAARGTGATATAGTAAAAAAPDPRDAEIDSLTRRLAELEARLADLERSRPGGGPRRPGAGRGQRSARRVPNGVPGGSAGGNAAPGRSAD